MWFHKGSKLCNLQRCRECMCICNAVSPPSFFFSKKKVEIWYLCFFSNKTCLLPSVYPEVWLVVLRPQTRAGVAQGDVLLVELCWFALLPCTPVGNGSSESNELWLCDSCVTWLMALELL